jgi:plastocyanin
MERALIRMGLVTVFATALMGPWASPAVAGGGCHAAMTQGKGNRVEMVKACFTPSVLRTDPGTEVTFVNRDPTVHNVSAEWSYISDLSQGDKFTATFSEPGVYPFACTYHPGMVGAVVVGDGTGAGSGRTVTVGEASESKVQASSGQAGDRAAARPASSDGPARGWLAGGAGGLALGAGVVLGAGWLVRRKRAGD